MYFSHNGCNLAICLKFGSVRIQSMRFDMKWNTSTRLMQRLILLAALSLTFDILSEHNLENTVMKCVIQSSFKTVGRQFQYLDSASASATTLYLTRD